MPAESSGSSGAINVFQNPTIKTGTQIFLANYFPSDWTGQVEAVPLNFANGTLTAGNPIWDAGCVLTGGTCNSTGGTNTVEGPASRVMLTWSGTAGMPFEFNSFSAAQVNTRACAKESPLKTRCRKEARPRGRDRRDVGRRAQRV